MDRYIYPILKQWKDECGVEGSVQFKYSSSSGVLTIYTAYPGYFIGKAGRFIVKYKEIFSRELIFINEIEFKETSKYEVI